MNGVRFVAGLFLVFLSLFFGFWISAPLFSSQKVENMVVLDTLLFSSPLPPSDPPLAEFDASPYLHAKNMCEGIDMEKIWESPEPKPEPVERHPFISQGIQIWAFPKYRLVFCAVPKVASSSMVKAFAALFHRKKPTRKRVYKKLPNQQILNATTLPFFLRQRGNKTNEGQDYASFHLIRNPITRIISSYENRVLYSNEKKYQRILKNIQNYLDKPPIPDEKTGAWINFNQWIEAIAKQNWPKMNHHWMPVTHLCLDDSFEYDYIGRLEEPDTFKLVSQKFLSNVPVPNINFTSKKPKRLCQLLTPRILNLILAIYKEDFRRFRYNIPPEVCECKPEDHIHGKWD